jgi:DNA-binding Lrp family transcriptional regulator
MGATDRKILAELQRDGRLSLTDLGERIGLSLSPCDRRVGALEEAGVITDYRAIIDPAAIGLNFSAIVFVTLREGSRDSVLAFEEAVPGIPEIIRRNASSATLTTCFTSWPATWRPFSSFMTTACRRCRAFCG